MMKGVRRQRHTGCIVVCATDDDNNDHEGDGDDGDDQVEDDDDACFAIFFRGPHNPEARRQGVTPWRLVVTLA